jgi:hypothetical protein
MIRKKLKKVVLSAFLLVAGVAFLKDISFKEKSDPLPLLKMGVDTGAYDLQYLEDEQKSGETKIAFKSRKHPAEPLWTNKTYFQEQPKKEYRIRKTDLNNEFWKFQNRLWTKKEEPRKRDPLGITLGIEAGVHYNQGLEQSVALKREKEMALFLEYDLWEILPYLHLNIKGSFGYSSRPSVLQYGEIVADYLTFGLGFITSLDIGKDYWLFLETGMEAAKLMTYNYTSYENNKEYQIEMEKWVPLLKISLGLESDLKSWVKTQFLSVMILCRQGIFILKSRSIYCCSFLSDGKWGFCKFRF